MVDDAETLHALYHILEVDVVVMAFAAALLQWGVLAVLNADGEVGAWNRVLAARDGEQVGLGDEVEECLPLFRVLLILQVEIYQVYTAVGISLLEAVAPLSLLVPFLCSLHQFRVVAVVLCIDSFLLCVLAACICILFAAAAFCLLALCTCREGWSHSMCCHE